MKKSIYHLTAFLLLLACGSALQAQSPARAIKTFETDGVKALLFNSADGCCDLERDARYEVPRGSNRNTFFARSLWIGGFDAGSQLHLGANTYRQAGQDFFAGPVANPGAYDGVGFNGAPSTYATSLLVHSNGSMVAVTQDSIVIHNPVTGTTMRYGLPINPLRAQTVELSDGRVLVLGTGSITTVQPSYIFEMNNPTGGLTVSTLGPHNNSAIVQLRDGRLMLHGGASNEIFDLSNNLFTAFSMAPIQQCFRSGIQLQNDTVLFVGGNAGCSAASGGSPTSYYYDLGTGVWVTGPQMNASHFQPSIVELPSHELLIFGGNHNDSIVERYNPVSGAFSPAGYLDFPAIATDAELLQDGRVLVTLRTSNNRYWADFYDPSTNTSELVGLLLDGVHVAQLANHTIYLEVGPHQYRQFDIAEGIPVGQRFQRIWELKAAQIDQFRSDFAASTVNFANYPDIASWPGNGNVALGESAQLAPYVDVNGDGLYRPAQDGDYPCISGDHAMWWIYNDNGLHLETGGAPMGVQVETMAYVVDCDLSPCPDSSFRYHTFYHVEVTNRSSNSYHDTYIGQWADVDLGNWYDDYIGCDTALNLGYVYNGDNDDEGPNGYGPVPPAAGIIAFPNPLTPRLSHFQYYSNDFSATGNPTTPEEHYGYMVSVWKDGQPVVNNGLDGWPSTAPGTPTNFMFPGDPGCGNPAGWNEFTAANMPFDRRILQSFGPFELAPEATWQLDYGVLFAQGTDNINSVCALKTSAQNALTWWNTSDRSCYSEIVGREQPISTHLSWTLSPNPATNQAQIIFSSAIQADGQVQLLDMTGRALRTWALTPGVRSHAFTLAGVADGIYLVQVQDGQASSTRRLVVQH
jgi:hypothetical protein